MGVGVGRGGVRGLQVRFVITPSHSGVELLRHCHIANLRQIATGVMQVICTRGTSAMKETQPQARGKFSHTPERGVQGPM